MVTLGDLVRAGEAGRALAAQMRARLAELTAKVRPDPPKRVFVGNLV